MLGLAVDALAAKLRRLSLAGFARDGDVWTWLRFKLRKKRKMRFPNGIPRALTPDGEFVAQQMLLVESKAISYTEFLRRIGYTEDQLVEFYMRLDADGREHG